MVRLGGRLQAQDQRFKTLSDAVLCVFQRTALWELQRQSPAVGFTITWLTASEASLVDEKLLSVGRQTAEERIAALLVLLFHRAGLISGAL